MVRRVSIFFLVFILSFIIQCKQTPQIEKIPLEDFFKNPSYSKCKISPDGEKISFMRPWQNRMNIYIRNINEEIPVRLTSATQRDIPNYFWANSQRIIYVQDKGGDENYQLYAVNIDGSDFKNLTPMENVKIIIVDFLIGDEDHILIGTNQRNKQLFDIYRLNINDGEYQLSAKNPGNLTHWLSDHNGNLRLTMATDGGTTKVLYRESEQDQFSEILQVDYSDIFHPRMFDFNNQDLIVSSNIDRDKLAFFRYDPRTKKNIDLIFEHPDVDVDRILFSRYRQTILGVLYDLDYPTYHFFDPQRASIQQTLESQLKNSFVMVIDKSRNEDNLVVKSYSDVCQGAYFHYNINNKKLIKLASLSPWLEKRDLSEVKPYHYYTRDSLFIHGYVSFPLSRPPKDGYPLVVLPHGGPWLRDTWGFDPNVQFFTNRGYAVLQSNYRGSSGFGKKFLRKGFKNYPKMLDDLEDGVLSMIEDYQINEDRVCIFGYSFGGYLALSGVAFKPERFHCAISYCGISNLFSLLENLPEYWKPMIDHVYEMFGNPVKDSLLLYNSSPLFHIKNIKAPVLIAQGANDPRVSPDQSDKIVEGLQQRGIDVRYFYKENEGHGFRNEENRLEFYQEIEKFLDDFMKPDSLSTR